MKEMNKEVQGKMEKKQGFFVRAPIFHHYIPLDECDCIECRARVEKGGLDFDPSNDDEEFEEHERQVMRDTGIDEEEK